MLALLISPILLAAPVALGQTLARGTVSTGGGILVRPKGAKPMTLADAGYVFKQVETKVLNPKYQDYYPISDATKAALSQILSELPAGLSVESLAQQIWGGNDRSIFVRQSKVDAKDYAQIKSVYSSVIRSFGQRLDPSIFMLIAYSKANQTFILPDFDDKDVTEEQRALNLIHEWNMRGAPESQSPQEAQKRLQRALMIDYAIHQYRKSVKSNADTLEFFNQMRKLDTPFYSETDYHRALNKDVAQLIGQVEAKAGRPLLMSELFLMRLDLPPSDNEAMDKNLVHHFDALVPGVAERLGSLRFYRDFILDIETDWYFYGHRRTDPLSAGKWRWDQQQAAGYLARSQRVEPLDKRATAISKEQCAQNGHLLQASKMKSDALLHYDEVLGRVLEIYCQESGPAPGVLWATSHVVPPREW
jgi:hypothetical protein